MKTQFEEKTYENYMNIELLSEEKIIFAPGQVYEHNLGFDVAMHTKNDALWRYFYPYPPYYPYRGLQKDDKIFELYLSGLPRFKYNCFIQYKRPTYLSSSSCKEFIFWRKPYFRYEVSLHQQRILSTISTHCKNRALVVYACPAFSTSGELIKHYRTNSLVDNSNFCEVKKLQNHHRYSFVEPGVEGYAHSIEEPIRGIPFKENLRKLSASENSNQNLGDKEFIIQTSKTIDEAMQEPNNPFSFSYHKLVEEAEHYIGISKIYLALHKIFVFQIVMDVQVFFGF